MAARPPSTLNGSAVRLPLREAVAAVDRLVAAGLERNFRNLAAATAGGLEHLAGGPSAAAAAAVASAPPAGRRPAAAAAATALALTSRSAVRATVGLVGEALGRKKFLLAGREGEG